MQDFRNLRVWHLAHALAIKVVEALPSGSTGAVPGLRSQAIRAVTSIPANLAEGCGRASRQEFLHFVEIALGSHKELEAHLRLASGAHLISAAAYSDIMIDLEVQRRMLVGLMRTLQRRIAEAENSLREGSTAAGD